MAQIELQQIKAANGRLYGVVWDDSSGAVYVHEIGGFGVNASKRSAGKASDARAAMAKAEAWVHMQSGL